MAGQGVRRASPYLDDDTLDALAQRVGEGQRAAARIDAGRGTRAAERKVVAGRAAAAEILESVHPLLVREVTRVLAHRDTLGGYQASLERGDLESEATAIALATIASHRPGKASLVVRIAREVAQGLSRYGNGPDVDDRWRRIGRLAWSIRSELVDELGRPPSAEELEEAVTARSYRHAESHVTARGGRLDGEELAAAVHASMTKDGTRAALNNLAEVMAATAGMASLDDAGDDEGFSLAGRLSDPEDCPEHLVVGPSFELSGAAHLLVEGIDDTDVRGAVVDYLIRQEEKDGCTFAEVADECGVDALEVRRAVKAARRRMSSPHGQFCHMAAELETSFEDAVEVVDTRDAIAAALASRR